MAKEPAWPGGIGLPKGTPSKQAKRCHNRFSSVMGAEPGQGVDAPMLVCSWPWSAGLGEVSCIGSGTLGTSHIFNRNTDKFTIIKEELS